MLYNTNTTFMTDLKFLSCVLKSSASLDCTKNFLEKTMPSILVVDDTSVDRRLAGGLLEKNTAVDVRYAENGAKALEEIQRELPDLILTDLQMPEMDGLELVKRSNEEYPDIPIVLMTAHGSEVIAAQALANGATSYVPKADLGQDLVETVMHIVAMSQADSRYRKLISSATKMEFEFELENDPGLIEPLIDLVQQILTSKRILDSSERVRIGVALEHAVYNAMVRGNLEIKRDAAGFSDHYLIKERASEGRFNDRKVRVDFRVNRQQVYFNVADQGTGFDLNNVPKSGDPEAFKDGVGRGLVLMSTFMDELVFEDDGRRLTMVKNIAA